MDETDTRAMLTTLMEVVRMIRDGDPTSFDEKAVDMYDNLNNPK